MTPERYARLSKLFLEAAELVGEERSAFLDQACEDDPALRAELEAMLTDGGVGLLDRVNDETAPLPERIGAYKIVGLLGEGGMGVVYLAEQTDPIRRRVALKLIKPGMDTRQVVARFESERQALALMNHPNVAKVFEAGSTVEGRPFFVMEHVPGVPITTYCDEHRLSTADRLDLFYKVCQAVQHAHQKGIVHRDIKPSNILVSVQDDLPAPKVIDFGVAKATGQHLTEKTLFTEQGQLIGTPEYMSPEQAQMGAQDIDTRTDIYSLGVVLYELLAGALPFEPKSLRQAGLFEIHRVIREQDPPKPSTRLSSLGDESGTVARNRRTNQSSLERELRGDLDWITMKAMEKDRTRRYASASELAEDIVRHLRHEPISASPPGLIYRFRKFVLRHRGNVMAGAVVVGVALTAFGFFQYRRYRDAWEVELQHQSQAKDRKRQAVECVFAGIERQQAGDLEAARHEFERALIYDPDEVSALGNLAILRKDRYFSVPAGKANRSLLKDSRTLCERALGRNPNRADIWNVQCVTLYALGDLAAAEQACRSAVRLNRDYYAAGANLAKVLTLQGRIDDALVAAAQAVETATRLGEANTVSAEGPWQTLATIQLYLGDPTAMQSLKRSFECPYEDEWGYVLRARLRLSLPGYKDDELALTDATIANELSAVPDSRIKRTLALALLRNSRYEDAIRTASEALELGGFIAAHHLILSIAHANRSEMSLARDHLDAALAAWPEHFDDRGVIVTAEREGLWLDSVEDLQRLRAETEKLIRKSP